jgi:hypothetical protein
MQFISFYKPGAGPERMAEMNAFVRGHAEKGHLILGGGFKQGEPGFRARLANGIFTVEDGAPATDGLGGCFGILKANSRDEMMTFIKDFLSAAGGGECNVRILMDGPPPAE